MCEKDYKCVTEKEWVSELAKACSIEKKRTCVKEGVCQCECVYGGKYEYQSVCLNKSTGMCVCVSSFVCGGGVRKKEWPTEFPTASNAKRR